MVGAAWTPDTRLVAGHSPGPGEVAIDVATARRSGLGRGDRVKVLFEGLVQEFAVGGVTRGNRIVSASLASFDLATAQRVLGKGGRLDAVSVRAEPGVSAEALRARVAAALPESYEVLTADQAARQAKESWARSLRFLTPGLMVLAGVALLVGGFIVFNTFSMVVAQRSRELGLLRALGASRRQVTVSVLGEAVLVGGAASAAGIGGGLGAAPGLLALLRAFGLAAPPAPVVFHGLSAAAGLLAGVLVTALAAMQPARQANRVAPLAAIDGAPEEASAPRRERLAGGVATASAGGAIVLLGVLGRGHWPLMFAGSGAVLVGVVLLAPFVAAPAARLIGAPLVRVLGWPALLGRQNALRSPRRTAGTASALMVGIGLVGVVAVLGASMKASAKRTIESSMLADFVVSSYQVPGGASGVPPVAADRLRRSPAVAAVSEVRSGQWGLHGKTETLVAIDPATVTSLYRLDPGSTAAARRLDDGGVLVRDSVAARHGWRVGDPVPMIFARTGTRNVTLQATYSSTTVRSDYVISLGAFAANYVEQLDMEVDVRLVAGTTSSAGRQAIRRALSDYPNLAVHDRSEVLAAEEQQVDRVLLPMVALLALSVVIALLGIANTLALSVHERIRELGLLRAIGMARAQLRVMIRAEALIIASVGTVLGGVMAVFFGWVLVAAMRGPGLTRTALPLFQLVAAAAVAGAASLAAAALPARRAARLGVLDALAVT